MANGQIVPADQILPNKLTIVPLMGNRFSLEFSPPSC